MDRLDESSTINKEYDFPTFRRKFRAFDYSEPDLAKWERFSLGHFCIIDQRQENDDWRLKIFRLPQQNQEKFSTYLSQICDFAEAEKYSFKTNFLTHVMGFCAVDSGKGLKDFYIAQKNPKEKFLLKYQTQGMLEIECLSLIRNIVKLYSHLFGEEELMANLQKLGVTVIDIKSMFYYRKFYSEENAKKLTRNKLKFDFLNFQTEIFVKEGSLEKLHLDDLLNFLQIFQFEKMGMALKIFKYRLENHESISWKKIFANPMFLQSIDGRIDWGYWNLTEFEKEELSFPEVRKTMKVFKKGPPPRITFAFSEQQGSKTSKKTLQVKNEHLPRKLSNTHEESKNNKMEKPAEIFKRHNYKRKTTEKIECEISGLRRILSHFRSPELSVDQDDLHIVQGWAVYNLDKLSPERKKDTNKLPPHYEVAKKKYEKEGNKFNKKNECETILRRTEVIPGIYQTFNEFQEVFKEIIKFQ